MIVIGSSDKLGFLHENRNFFHKPFLGGRHPAQVKNQPGRGGNRTEIHYLTNPLCTSNSVFSFIHNRQPSMATVKQKVSGFLPSKS